MSELRESCARRGSWRHGLEWTGTYGALPDDANVATLSRWSVHILRERMDGMLFERMAVCPNAWTQPV